MARTDADGPCQPGTFNSQLRHAFAAVQGGANPFGVLYLDLDRFKEVNNTQGHALRDELRKRMGNSPS